MQVETIASCNKSSDCTRSDGTILYCFSDPIFIDIDYVCNCSVWFGWKGENCDEETNALIFNRITTIIVLIMAFFVTALSLRSLLLNCLVSGLKIDYMFLTGLSINVASIFTALTASLILPSFYDPSSFKINEYSGLFFKNFEIIDPIAGKYIASLTILSQLFQVFSLIFMINSWEEIVSIVAMYKSTEHAKENKRKLITLLLFLGLWIFLTMILILVQLIFTAIFINIILYLSLAIFFITSSKKIISTLNEICYAGYYAKENQLVFEIIKFIKLIRNIVSVGLTAFSVILILYSNLLFVDTYDTYMQPGDFNFILFIFNLARIIGLSIALIISWYINSVTNGAVLAELYPLSCYIFKLWDRKNTELIPE